MNIKPLHIKHILFLIAAFVIVSGNVFAQQKIDNPTLLRSSYSEGDASKPNIILIFTDDQGYADLGAQGVVNDILTPNIDKLAKSGARMTHGYVTAPQCVPSRAGIMTGIHQNKFGMEGNHDGPMLPKQITIAEVLKDNGYTTGMAGKWHLGLHKYNRGNVPHDKLDSAFYLPGNQGFLEYLSGAMKRYTATHKPDGTKLKSPDQKIFDPRFRIDVQSEWVINFIKRNAENPFFLYLAYFAPHVPLEAPMPYMSYFPDTTDPTRHKGLAMMNAIDKGVGDVVSLLDSLQLTDNTLIFYISDNGAPVSGTSWDGSINTPMIGEKGMLTDGGIRVPYIVNWENHIPKGQIYEHPVSTLDVFPTALAAAGISNNNLQLDGANLLPYLHKKSNKQAHEALYWRWRYQAAVRSGKWKYIVLNTGEEYLFNLKKEIAETNNLADSKKAKCKKLNTKLLEWCETNKPAGFKIDTTLPNNKTYNKHFN